jgi:2-oxoglutarate ferredoxin oxidoreductase subunit delta
MKILAIDEKTNLQGVYTARVEHPEKCIACGACFEVCPDVCIEIYELEGNET